MQPLGSATRAARIARSRIRPQEQRRAMCYPVPSLVRGFFEGQIRAGLTAPWPRAVGSAAPLAVDEVDEDPARTAKGQALVAAVRFLSPGSDEELHRKLEELGVLSAGVPAEHGGSGLNVAVMAAVADAIAEKSPAAARMYHNHYMVVKAVERSGEDVRRKWLPRLAAGRAAWCLAEARAGSDVAAGAASAAATEEGGFKVDGTKGLVSGADAAAAFAVFAKAKTGDGERLTCFLLPRSDAVSSRAVGCQSAAEVTFTAAPAAPADVVGGVSGGYRLQDEVAAATRGWEVAAMVGAQRRLLRGCIERADSRRQFRRKLRDFAMVKAMIAESVIRLYAAESVAHALACATDGGQSDLTLDAASAKLLCVECAKHAADTAEQLIASDLHTSPELASFIAETRAYSVTNGTTELLALRVAQSGVESAGRALKEKGTLRLSADRTMRAVNKMLGGATVDRLPGVHPSLKKAASMTEAAVGEFGGVVEQIVIKFAMKLKDEQLICGRLAEAVMLLHSMCAVLSRCSHTIQSGHDSAAHEMVIANAWTRQCHQRLAVLVRELRHAYSTNDANLMRISDHCFDVVGYIPSHPYL
eukprot:TRINITY_DN1925_c4_g1_i3.p1 TRINITY_DN1925_c4_g1~~TRINITY_DN1925_c4_g1_i3.p1  ORF type:complete len:587 (+),score=166.70 TRINITY_DN1925_c4_g1_i3:127-1887(+)